MTKAQSASPGYFQSVVGWVRKGYPDGVPARDYYPLIALLARSLDEDQVVQAAWSVLKQGHPDNPVTAEDIRRAVHAVIEKEPNVNEINQVAGRLALVGWPLADHG